MSIKPKMIEYFITEDDSKICKHCFEELSNIEVHNCRKMTTVNIEPSDYETRIKELEELVDKQRQDIQMLRWDLDDLVKKVEELTP